MKKQNSEETLKKVLQMQEEISYDAYTYLQQPMKMNRAERRKLKKAKE